MYGCELTTTNETVLDTATYLMVIKHLQFENNIHSSVHDEDLDLDSAYHLILRTGRSTLCSFLFPIKYL